MMKKQIINSLKKLGLTKYESETYYTLTKHITLTATEISKYSNVPRSKVYDVLKRLKEKGYIETTDTRPIKYTVIPARNIYRTEKEKLIEELNETEETLINIYEKQISQVQAPVWLIHEEEKIIEKETEIIRKAKETINMRIGYILPNEITKLENTLKTIPHDIEIKILSSKEIKLKKQFQKLKNIKIKETELPSAKITIVDKKEMFHIFSKFDSQQEIIPNTSIGILNLYSDIVKSYDNRFLKQYNKLK